MKAIALYHPDSEFARSVEEYAHDFWTQRNTTVELVSLSTPEGADMAELYDVTQYPAILVIANDGRVVKIWQGDKLPLKDEVAGYLVTQ